MNPYPVVTGMARGWVTTGLLGAEGRETWAWVTKALHDVLSISQLPCTLSQKG